MWSALASHSLSYIKMTALPSLQVNICLHFAKGVHIFSSFESSCCWHSLGYPKIALPSAGGHLFSLDLLLILFRLCRSSTVSGRLHVLGFPFDFAFFIYFSSSLSQFSSLLFKLFPAIYFLEVKTCSLSDKDLVTRVPVSVLWRLSGCLSFCCLVAYF